MLRVRRHCFAIVLLALCCSCAAPRVAEHPAPTTGKWEKQISAFEAQDRVQPPKKGGVLFVGSSTIVGWDLDRNFPDLHALNRGFGGSQFSDAVHYADRVILPYRPSIVVVYDGDNDIADGKSPEQVFADFAALVAEIRSALPKARIIVLSIKPSIARWDKWDRMKQANAMMEEFARKEKKVDYLDIASPILGPDGRPRPELFRDDGLHLNAQGYELISALLRPLLPR